MEEIDFNVPSAFGLSEEEAGALLAQEDRVVVSQIESLTRLTDQQKAQRIIARNRLNDLGTNPSGPDVGEANRLRTQISELNRTIDALENQRNGLINARFDATASTNPNLVANNFGPQGFTQDELGNLVASDVPLGTQQTGVIAQDLATRVNGIIDYLQRSGDEQLTSIQESRLANQGINQAQLDRARTIFDQVRQGALATGAINQGIAGGIASRAGASGAQRLATINAQQATLAEQLAGINSNQAALERETLNNYLAGLNTIVGNENAIRQNTTTNVASQAGTLADNISALQQNELNFQRSVPDVLTTRASNELANESARLGLISQQLALQEQAAALGIALPGIGGNVTGAANGIGGIAIDTGLPGNQTTTNDINPVARSTGGTGSAGGSTGGSTGGGGGSTGGGTGNTGGGGGGGNTNTGSGDIGSLNASGGFFAGTNTEEPLSGGAGFFAGANLTDTSLQTNNDLSSRIAAIDAQNKALGQSVAGSLQSGFINKLSGTRNSTAQSLVTPSAIGDSSGSIGPSVAGTIQGGFSSFNKEQKIQNTMDTYGISRSEAESIVGP